MPTAPGYADVSVGLKLATLTRPAYITFGVDPVDTNPANVATSVKLAWDFAGSMNSLMDTNVTIFQIRVSMGTDGSEDLVYVASYTTAGAKSQPSAPPNVAQLVHKHTSRGGRRGRGRLFLPWVLAASDVDEAGVVLSARVTAVNAACQVFLTQLGVNTVPMVLLHNPGLSAAGAPNPVLTLVADPLVSTQRRRLGR